MNDLNNKIQIVSFTTSENESPNELLNMFLSFYSHRMIKKSKTVLAFNIEFPDVNEETKIMICSIIDFSKDYPGITDVNCYIIFLYLDKENSLTKLDEILQYMKDNCDETKKIFLIGVLKGPSPMITQKDIISQMEKFGSKYEYHLLKVNDAREVADYILQIFMYSRQHSVNEEKDESDLKDGGQSHSCIIF